MASLQRWACTPTCGLTTTVKPYQVHIHHKVTAYRITLAVHDESADGDVRILDEVWLGMEQEERDDAIRALAWYALNDAETSEHWRAANAAIWWLAK